MITTTKLIKINLHTIFSSGSLDKRPVKISVQGNYAQYELPTGMQIASYKSSNIPAASFLHEKKLDLSLYKNSIIDLNER